LSQKQANSTRKPHEDDIRRPLAGEDQMGTGRWYNADMDDQPSPDARPDRERIAIVLVDHGSRVPESNDQLLAVAAAYRRHSGRPIVEPAHMELAEPSIAAAFARCVERGATLVVVCPYFLAPGKHWSEDIPRLAAEAAKPYPAVRHVVAAPLGLDALMLDLIEKRIAQALL
jgi:sirohydrochlorin ferrochelatase